jgi:dihydropteroate synthase
MVDDTELVAMICQMIVMSPKPTPISLMNHTVEQAAAIIGAVVEKCAADGIKLERICMDPDLGRELGLVDGARLPHGGKPEVQFDVELGRAVLFKSER